MKDDIEVLFEDDEDKKLNEERMLEKEENLDDYVKDESLENIFPDKDDVKVDRLLEEFKEEDLEKKEEIKEEIKDENPKKKMKIWQIILICQMI